MNIALVILHADPSRGGAERYTADLARALLDRGHEVTTIAETIADGWPGAGPSGGLAYGGLTKTERYLQIAGAIGRDELGRDWSNTPFVDVYHAMLPVRGCDVYHPHAGLAAESFARGHRRHAARWRRWLAWSGDRANPRRRAYASVERELLSRRPIPPDIRPTVLCLSEVVKASVRHWYPSLPDDRLATLFNAVDLARFDPARDPAAGRRVRDELRIPSGGRVALIVAQDWARKGVAEAVAATARLSADGEMPVTLVVVGKRQGRLADDAPPHCRFVGEKPDVYPYYAAADLFVLPTRHDPCSLVVLEALAMGVPVVSTRFNGACEVMADGVHGRVLDDPADAGALADAVREFLRPDRNAAARAACLALRPALSFERHVDALEAVYRDVARRKAVR